MSKNRMANQILVYCKEKIFEARFWGLIVGNVENLKVTPAWILMLWLSAAPATFSQSFEFIGYKLGMTRTYDVEDSLWPRRTIKQSISTDTLIGSATWFKMTSVTNILSESEVGSDTSEYFVRAIDTMYYGKVWTFSDRTFDFVNILSLIFYPAKSDTVIAETKYTANCNEFHVFGFSDSCISSTRVTELTSSFKTYSKRLGLIYSLDSGRGLGSNPYSKWVLIETPSLKVKTRSLHNKNSNSISLYRINGAVRKLKSIKHSVLDD